MPPERRDMIQARAAELFATKGVGATTVRDIGQAAGVYSGSLYHYFPSKEAIVAAILQDFVDGIRQRFETVAAATDDPLEVVRGLIHETLEIIDEHPHPTAIYQNDRRYLRDHGLLEPIDAASREVRGYWLRALDQGIADGVFRDDVPAELFYRTVRDTLWATMHWPTRARYATDEFADLMTGLLLDGFRR